MKTIAICACGSVIALLAAIPPFGQLPGNAARTNGVPALAERTAALEALVTSQSNQIAVLTMDLEAEVRARIEAQVASIAAATNYTNQRLRAESAARRSADAALQSQIESIASLSFSTNQVATLQGLAELMIVAETNIFVTGDLCVAGNIAIADGHRLFANYIQPNDGGCSGDLGGITMFMGHVGIASTSSLYVNAIRPIVPVPLSPDDCPEGCSLQPGGLIVTLGAPILFRRQ